MNNLSERVQREFESWKEKYEITDYMEFHVKTLLKLQEEYDQVDVGSNTTKTRESLLGMIQKLHMSMNLREKVNLNRPMYIDCVSTEGRFSDKVIVYYSGNITVLDGIKYSYKDYASMINSIIKQNSNMGMTGRENMVIYIDTRGFGLGLYDELIQYKDLVVKPLNTKKQINM